MAFSSFFITAAVLVSTSQGFPFGSTCLEQYDCISCVTHKSLSGDNCRWCPRDNKCHAFGGVANPCSRSRNVVHKDGCTDYDPNLAYKMVYLSALAYADNVTNYIAKATEVSTFNLVKQVTKPCSGNAQCSGFTAVSHTERAIAVAFRGSQTTAQIIIEALTILIEPKVPFQAGGKVQAYFNDAFQLVWRDLKGEIYRQITKYPSYKVWVTGHSLGAALASLASTVLAYEGKTTKDKLILYTFGQPRVGNYDYALAHDKLVPASFRVTHYRDPVVHLPTCNKIGLTAPCLTFFDGPYHHGNEIFYDEETMSQSSSYEKCEGLPHNEDIHCSNGVFVWAPCFLPSELENCLKDHRKYFDVLVSKWWKNAAEA